MSVVAATAAPIEALVLRKVTLRLIPFLFLLYVINLIDRTNIGMARLQMVKEQHMFDEKAYALGAGLFYIGYLLFEVPSNLILARVGARAWIARILLSWGLISSAMMFVTGAWSFYVLRVLLGFAEAGFFPGIILYLSHWFPARARGHATASFMTAGVVAGMVGSPISGIILDNMDQVVGLWGWQWVFLLEGLPAVLLGFVTLYFLTDRPEQARWLSDEERNWLMGQLAEENSNVQERRSHDLYAAFVNPRVWLLIAIYFTVAVGDNSYGFYAPTFLSSRFPDWKPSEIGQLMMLPGAFAIIGMVVMGWHSDRTGERRWHVAWSAFLAAAGWLAMAVAPSPWLFVAGLAVTLTGMKSMLPTFWTLPASFLRGTAAAGGIALINSVANLGGFFGPQIIGKVKEATGDFTGGLMVMSATLAVGGLLALCVQHRREPSAEADRNTELVEEGIKPATSSAN